MKINTTVSIDISSVGTINEARRTVQKKYNEAKRQTLKNIAELVSSLPDGECILNKDLAKMAGISPSHMSNIIGRYPNRIYRTKIPVVRRFIEVDEAGNIIGKVIESRLSFWPITLINKTLIPAEIILGGDFIFIYSNCDRPCALGAAGICVIYQFAQFLSRFFVQYVNRQNPDILLLYRYPKERSEKNGSDSA